MPFDTYAYFYVRDFEGKAEQVTDLLKLTPTRTWMKGELGPANRPRKFSNWELQSSLPRTEAFQDRHLVTLLEALEGRREQILEAVSKYKCGLQGVGYYTNENPGFHMDSQLISRIAALGLSVDFDLYCNCEHDDPGA
ncbi:DUF4279 domain-containing protein [Pseudomonas stutzeri]|uniref:DUF4279 domain-containing protein n=1 Tax=Stutzerimonas degradans TaxID=2968968 RepID=UPI0013F4D36D|nr:DUF4279 domain-containing protein [Stutzerimonas degradans]